MSLSYENLDERTRHFMLQEIDLDISRKTLYMSPRLNEQGKRHYPLLLKDAAQNHDDDWLADELRRRQCISAFEQRRKTKGGICYC